MKKQFAFTLAEILTVIGIIGVVAGLTLPNLSNSTNDKEYVAMLKKTASSLQSALDLAKDKYGDYPTWTLNVSSDKDKAAIVGNRLSDYILPMKVCGSNANSKCFASSNVTAISGSSSVASYDSNSNTYKFILKDGTSIAFSSNNLVQMDLDGPTKGFNKVGRDIFNIKISEEGNLSFFEKTILTTENVTACRNGNALFCSAWVEEFDNNDYIRCSTLAYNGNITCK